MSVESFKQGFLARWLQDNNSGSGAHPRMTVILRNIQGHFFTVDMLWSVEEKRVYAFVIDSINQATTFEEEIKSGMPPGTFIGVFGRGENAKNIQNTIQEECMALELQSTVSFVTKFPGEWQDIGQSQYDDGSCAFFSLYYALCLQGYGREDYATFLQQIEANFIHSQNHHVDQGHYVYEPRYNRDGNRALPLSWDHLPFSILRPIQSKTGLRNVLQRRVEEEGENPTRDFTKLLAILENGGRNTFVIEFAKWVLNFGRLRLQREPYYGGLNQVFGEDPWGSQQYMRDFLLGTSNIRNGARFVEDWLAWLLQNPGKGLADRETVANWTRYISRFDMPEMDKIAITFDREETGTKGFFDENPEKRPLEQMLSSHLNGYLNQDGPARKAKLPLWFLLREDNRKSICGDSGKIDKQRAKATAKMIAEGEIPKPESAITTQDEWLEGVLPPVFLSEEPIIAGRGSRRGLPMTGMGLSSSLSMFLERGSQARVQDAREVRLVDDGVTRSCPALIMVKR